MKPTLILIPTYNEKDNIGPICDAVLKLLPEVHIIIVDDNSPDGTGDIALELSNSKEQIHVLQRPKKEGLGRAYLAGFRWALEKDFEFIFEMDADFSHDPCYLKPMLEAAETADMVIGSRYVENGGTEGWGKIRELISRSGGLYARTVLGVKVQDLTAGFVCYRKKVLTTLDLDAVRIAGYGFQIEMKYLASKAGFILKEVPIVFKERAAGESKMSLSIFIEAMLTVWKLRFTS